ncbi:MAG: hypothetical protein MRY83_02290 [Flavobacteriales bacterium]|nr:hypothetical protein [Flavobacteriales bacterium]
MKTLGIILCFMCATCMAQNDYVDPNNYNVLINPSYTIEDTILASITSSGSTILSSDEERRTNYFTSAQIRIKEFNAGIHHVHKVASSLILNQISIFGNRTWRSGKAKLSAGMVLNVLNQNFVAGSGDVLSERDPLPNSYSRDYSAGVGATYQKARSLVGISASNIFRVKGFGPSSEIRPSFNIYGAHTFNTEFFGLSMTPRLMFEYHEAFTGWASMLLKHKHFGFGLGLRGNQHLYFAELNLQRLRIAYNLGRSQVDQLTYPNQHEFSLQLAIYGHKNATAQELSEL